MLAAKTARARAQGMMQYMPPLPVEVNAHLMEVVLARSSASGLYPDGGLGPPLPQPGAQPLCLAVKHPACNGKCSAWRSWRIVPRLR